LLIDFFKLIHKFFLKKGFNEKKKRKWVFVFYVGGGGGGGGIELAKACFV